MTILEIHDLHVSIDETPILKGLNLKIKSGEIHAVMGPNGAGKSTLAKVLAGHPHYEVTGGEILVEGRNIVEMEPEERAHLGLFVSFQYPPEVPGVTTNHFLKETLNAHRKAKNLEILDDAAFDALLEQKMNDVEMKLEFKERPLNAGFSGGEKKRGEILQMALLEPALSILDEIDSGLDIDAMRVIACAVKRLLTQERSLLLITHYQRLLDYIRPHFVHIFHDGKIVKSGDADLASTLEKNGYEWVLG